MVRIIADVGQRFIECSGTKCGRRTGTELTRGSQEPGEDSRHLSPVDRERIRRVAHPIAGAHRNVVNSVSVAKMVADGASNDIRSDGATDGFCRQECRTLWSGTGGVLLCGQQVFEPLLLGCREE